jgi:peroxiredoxin
MPRPRSEIVPAVVALAIGVPLVAAFALAVHDGETRRREAPLRAILGDAAFDELARGEKSEQHYLGNELSAPDFTLRDAKGRAWRLRDQRGKKLVVMNFWTITCQPCIEEMPSYLELARRVAGRDDIAVVSITTDKDPSDVRAVVPPNGPLTVLFDPDKKIVRDKYGTRLFPETWLVDARGVIRLRVDGPRDWSSALAWDVIESFL